MRDRNSRFHDVRGKRHLTGNAVVPDDCDHDMPMIVNFGSSHPGVSSHFEEAKLGAELFALPGVRFTSVRVVHSGIRSSDAPHRAWVSFRCGSKFVPPFTDDGKFIPE